MKIIVLLTDGQGDYDVKYEQMAIERGIRIYTVGLGTGYDAGLLVKIALHTVDIVKDSDHDGLSDYHEDRIRLFNGMIIALNSTMSDTDSDGLLDGEEIVQRTDKQGRVFFSMLSYPHKKDSDRDDIEDKEDDFPLIPQKHSIDYLGSPKHLEAFNKKIEEKKSFLSSLSSLDSDVFFEFLGSYGTKILMDDYYTFLKERKINTEGRFREDYWKNDRDRYRTTTVQNSTPMFY